MARHFRSLRPSLLLLFLCLCSCASATDSPTPVPTASGVRLRPSFKRFLVASTALITVTGAAGMCLTYRRRTTFPIRGRRWPLLLFTYLSVCSALVCQAASFVFASDEEVKDTFIFMSGLAFPLVWISFGVRTWLLHISFQVAHRHRNRAATLDDKDRAWLQLQARRISAWFWVPRVLVLYGLVQVVFVSSFFVVKKSPNGEYKDALIKSGVAMLLSVGTGLLALRLHHFSDDGYNIKSELRVCTTTLVLYLLGNFAFRFLVTDLTTNRMMFLSGFICFSAVYIFWSIFLPLGVSFVTEWRLREQTRPLREIMGTKQEDDFREFLAMEFCEESLDFYNESKAFLEAVEGGLDEQTQRDRARHLYDEYISDAAPHQINISFQLRVACKSLLATPGNYDAKAIQSVVLTTQGQVFNLLERDAVPRYQRKMRRNARKSTVFRCMPDSVNSSVRDGRSVRPLNVGNKGSVLVASGNSPASSNPCTPSNPNLELIESSNRQLGIGARADAI